jgi:hypothetical protein
MRSMILTGCLWFLSLATSAQQTNGRVPSGPIKWGMNGSVEALPGDLAYYHSSRDTASNFKRGIANSSTALGGNPNATRFESLRAQCDNNSMTLNWVAIQQFGAERYEIEQSTDGRNWSVIGSVPANRTEFGEANYSFNYFKNVSNVFFRITATSIGGDRILSSIMESPCDNNSYIGVTINPVYSSTNVKIGSPSNSRVKMLVLDARAEVLQAKDAVLLTGLNYIPLDMSNLPSGNYTLVVSWLNGKQEIIKLVKK